MKSQSDLPSDSYIRSLARGLAVIRTFGAERLSRGVNNLTSTSVISTGRPVLM